MSKADLLRRAMGKKIPEIMEKEKQSFLTGAVKRGIQEAVAERIWNLIEYFSGYGFNKSHSTAYAFISYQTAYLKANFPLQFMTALLTSEIDNTDKIVRYIEESKRMGINVEPPSVNESESKFTCLDNKIRFGLNAVKNVGSTAVESILKAKRETGKFESLFDLVSRVDLRVCNRKVMESLIKCGAFDCFGSTRAQMMNMVDGALEQGAQVQRDRGTGQLSLLDQMGEGGGNFHFSQPLTEIEEWPENELLAYEREILGFYVSAHPLARFSRVLKIYSSTNSHMLRECRDQEGVGIGGVVNSVKEITTKRGERMAFVTLEDLDGTCEVIVFPETFKAASDLIHKDSTVFVRGKVNSREENPKVIAEEIIPLEDVEKKLTKAVAIDLATAGLSSEILAEIKNILVRYPGRVPVHLSFRDPAGKRVVVQSGDRCRIEVKPDLFKELEDLAGVQSIRVKT